MNTLRSLATLALLACLPVLASAQAAARETVTPAFSYPLSNVPGKSVTGLIVSYPPGVATPPHRHGKAFVTAYVLEGAIRSKVDDEPEKVYRAGESWIEKPGAHHRVGANASSTEAAKLLAVFVHETGAKDLLVFDADTKAAPKKP